MNRPPRPQKRVLHRLVGEGAIVESPSGVRTEVVGRNPAQTHSGEIIRRGFALADRLPGRSSTRTVAQQPTSVAAVNRAPVDVSARGDAIGEGVDPDLGLAGEPGADDRRQQGADDVGRHAGRRRITGFEVLLESRAPTATRSPAAVITPSEPGAEVRVQPGAGERLHDPRPTRSTSSWRGIDPIVVISYSIATTTPPARHECGEPLDGRHRVGGVQQHESTDDCVERPADVGPVARSPSTKYTLPSLRSLARRRARASASGARSMPITVPDGPTSRRLRTQHRPRRSRGRAPACRARSRPAVRIALVAGPMARAWSSSRRSSRVVVAEQVRRPISLRSSPVGRSNRAVESSCTRPPRRMEAGVENRWISRGDELAPLGIGSSRHDRGHTKPLRPRRRARREHGRARHRAGVEPGTSGESRSSSATQLPERPGRRPGVPQADHLHVLLPGGMVALETLLPGLRDGPATRPERVAARCPTELLWLNPAGWIKRFPTRHEILSASRELIEWHTRRLVAARPASSCATAVGARPPHGRVRERVAGIRGRAAVDGGRSDDGAFVDIEADLVVDATGRRSRLPDWLERAGYERPAETRIDAHLGYATRIYRRPARRPRLEGRSSCSRSHRRRTGWASCSRSRAIAGSSPFRASRDDRPPARRRRLPRLRREAAQHGDPRRDP